MVNLETTLEVDGFPVAYVPVRRAIGGVRSAVSGVGFSIAKALTTLGHHVDLYSLCGDDDAARLVRGELGRLGIGDAHVVPLLSGTPQSVVLYDDAGRRAIVTDLKDSWDAIFPARRFVLDGVDLAVIANAPYARGLLPLARAAGVPIVTDVHVLTSLDDDHNREHLAAADVLFLSGEGLPTAPRDWIHALWSRYDAPVVVVGLGADGALLGVRGDGRIEQVPAVAPRPVVSTVGAGDALVAGFCHGYATHGDPYRALREAVVFAGWTVGSPGASDGYLTASELDRWVAEG